MVKMNMRRLKFFVLCYLQLIIDRNVFNVPSTLHKNEFIDVRIFIFVIENLAPEDVVFTIF